MFRAHFVPRLTRFMPSVPFIGRRVMARHCLNQQIARRLSSNLTRTWTKQKCTGNEWMQGMPIRIFFLSNTAVFNLIDFNELEKEKISTLQKTIEQSKSYIQNGEHIKAELMLRVALIRALIDQDENALISIYELLANHAYNRNNYEAAEKWFGKVLGKLSVENNKDDIKFIYCHWMLAKIYEIKGDDGKALEEYNDCKKLFEQHLAQNAANTAKESLTEKIELLNWYSTMLLAEHRLAEASKYYWEAYNLSVNVDGKEHRHTMNYLSSLSTFNDNKSDRSSTYEYISLIAGLG